MKNILFIKESRGNYRGGIEGKILSLAGEFHRLHNIRPVLLTTDKESLFAREFSKLGLQVYSIGMDKFWLSRNSITTLDALIAKHQIGILQSHAFRESILARFYRRKRNRIVNISRIHTHIRGSAIHPLKIAMYFLLDRLTCRWVDHFVVISELLKQELIMKTKVRADKISVIHNGIPALGPPDILPVHGEKLTRSLAMIGEIEIRKQQHLAVEALKILRSKGILVELHLIGRGEGDYYLNLINLIKDSELEDLVFLHGQVQPDGIYNIIKDSPVVLLPSLHEGIPTSIIEAMSIRKIVVTTPVGATRELVQNNVNGFLHSTGSAEEIVEILFTLFTAPSVQFNELRNNAYKTYQEKFALEGMIAGFYNVYHKLDN